MDEPEYRWPVLSWRLTAPESYVLRYGTGGHAYVAFKLAVKELVARRALRIDTAIVKSFARAKRVTVLSAGLTYAEARTEKSLAPVLQTFEQLDLKWMSTASSGVKGVDLRTFARAAVKAHSPRFSGAFIAYRDTVIACLIDRGLAAPGRKFTRTRSGAYADDELETWLQIGRDRLRMWLKHDPARALAYAGGAGPALLLVNQIYDIELDGLRHYAAAVGAGGGDGGGDAHDAPFGGPHGGHAGVGDVGTLDPSGLDAGGLDFGGLDFGGLDFAGLDFAGLDFGGLDGAFGSIDGGFAAGGGGGDGGGGGGDGGGGGGG